MTEIELITYDDAPAIFQPSTNYLDLTHVETVEQWQTVGNSLRGIEEGRSWWFGDWYLHGEDHFGDEQVYDFLDLDRVSDKTFKNCAWIASVFPPCDRVVGLSFSHHAAVAGDKFRSVRDGLLQEALSEGWSVKELTLRAKAVIGEEVSSPDDGNDAEHVDSDAGQRLEENGMGTPADAIHFMIHVTMPDLFGETAADVVDTVQDETELEELRLKANELLRYSMALRDSVIAKISA